LPQEVHASVTPVMQLHQETLEPLLDAVRSGRPEGEVLELVFNVLHVATYSALRRWAHAAVQINGHLNGLVWRGRPLQYVHGGDADDVAQDLAAAAAPLEAVGACFAYAAGNGVAFAVTEGARSLLGKRPEALRGRTLDWQARAEEPGLTTLSQVGGGRADLRHCDAPVLVLQPAVRRCTVGLCCEAAIEKGDAHTRFAFVLHVLTASQRPSVTLCRVAGNGPLLVERFWLGGFDAPVFSEGPLSPQLELDEGGLLRVVERCSRRLSPDVLHAGCFSYALHGKRYASEAFLVDRCSTLLLAHRADPATDDDLDSVWARATSL
jgi:hypothetical protein